MNRKIKKVSKRCRICGTHYHVGYTGVADGRCDTCAGIQRDGEGNAWYPWEQSHTYLHVLTGIEETVTRTQAFGKG